MPLVLGSCYYFKPVQGILLPRCSGVLSSCRSILLARLLIDTCSVDKCVNLYKDFIEQSNGQLESNVSAVKTGTSNSRPSGTAGTSEVTDRYYTVKEYRTLSPEQKKKLHELRKKRKSASGSSRVASVEANHKNTEGQSEPEKEGNRNHPALTRQKKRTKS